MTVGFESTVDQVVFEEGTGDVTGFSVEQTTAAFTVTGVAANGIPEGGSTGQALVKSSGADFDVEWDDVSGGGSGIPASTVDAKGDLIVASADNTVDNLAVGANGRVLMADSAETLGLKWRALDTTDVSGAVATSRTISTTSPVTGGGDLSASRTIAINDGTTSQKGAVQLEDSTASTSTTKAATPNSVKSAYDLANGAIPKSLVDAKGDLLVGTADNTVARLAVGGTNGHVLTVDSGEATGLKFAAQTGGGSGGGLVKVDSGTFSASSGFNVDGCFTSTYDDYLILMTFTCSTDVLVGMRLRASGTDSSTGYDSTRTFAGGSTGTDNSYLGTDEWFVVYGANGAPSSMRMHLFSPALAFKTTYTDDQASAYGAAFWQVTSAGRHDTASAYDGFAIRPNTGTITGRWAVYGYAK